MLSSGVASERASFCSGMDGERAFSCKVHVAIYVHWFVPTSC